MSESADTGVEICGIYRHRETGERAYVRMTATCPDLPETLVVYSGWLTPDRIAIRVSQFLAAFEKDCDD